MLDQQDRHVAVCNECCQQRLHLVDDQGGKPLGRLVENQKLRILQQGSRYRQHLLLASRQLTAAVTPALIEARKRLIDPLNGPSTATANAELEMFVDGERRPQAPALRRIGNTLGGNLVRRQAGNLLALKPDRPPLHRQQAHNRIAQRRFAHTVAPDNGVHPLLQG